MEAGAPDRVEVALAVLLREGAALVARRAAGSHLEGLWEFPGGKIEPGEEPMAAALRELAEETGLRATSAELLAVFHHSYTDRNVRLHAFLVRDATGEVAVDGRREWAWVPLASLAELPMPEANRAILRALSASVPR